MTSLALQGSIQDWQELVTSLSLINALRLFIASEASSLMKSMNAEHLINWHGMLIDFLILIKLLY